MGMAERPGHYVGVVLNTEGASKKAGFYFLEGNTKIWVDGETEQRWNTPAWRIITRAPGIT